MNEITEVRKRIEEIERHVGIRPKPWKAGQAGPTKPVKRAPGRPRKEPEVA